MPDRPTRFLFPLIFVPVDQGGKWPAGYITALDTAVDAALSWWTDALGFCPFAAAPTIAIGGIHPRAEYSAHPDTQERIRRELAAYYPELAGATSDAVGARQSLGLRPTPTAQAAAVYLVYATLGADPYNCPGNVIGTSAVTADGPAVLIVQSSGSLDAFLTGNNELDQATGSCAAQTGALAHELGHALGLPHPTDPETRALSVMWSWWDFPHCGLSDPEHTIAASTATNWLAQQATPASTPR